MQEKYLIILANMRLEHQKLYSFTGFFPIYISEKKMCQINAHFFECTSNPTCTQDCKHHNNFHICLQRKNLDIPKQFTVDMAPFRKLILLRSRNSQLRYQHLLLFLTNLHWLNTASKYVLASCFPVITDWCLIQNGANASIHNACNPMGRRYRQCLIFGRIADIKNFPE